MKILLIPKAFFGDIVLTTAAISALKQSNPSTILSVLVPPSAVSLLQGHPDITEVIPFDRRKEFRGFKGLRKMARQLRTRQFDRAYSFQKSPRTALLLWFAGIKERIGIAGSKCGFLYSRKVVIDEGHHEVLRSAQLVSDLLSSDHQKDWTKLSTGSEPLQPNAFALTLPVAHRDTVSERVMEVLRIDSPYVVLVPGSAWATKRWSLAGYREVASLCLREGKRVVLVGAEAERPLCDEIGADMPVVNLAGHLTLPELVRVVADAEGVVCNDSMALHVASSTKTPCVAVFCATSPKFGFGPWRNRAVVVEKEGLFCKPCRRHGSAKCPVGTYACIEQVTAAQVVNALHEVIGSQRVLGSFV